MKFQKLLFERLRADDYKPVDEAGLTRQLQLDKKQRRVFAHELRLLLARGELKLVG